MHRRDAWERLTQDTRVPEMVNDADRQWLQSMPEAYERGLVAAVFRPFAVDLAERVARLRPGHVLEVAAGTGALTSALVAALPSVVVTATDLSVPMVESGAARVPGARWRQADALRLPFENGQFDVVACQFGAMFFPDKPAGFAEARRVLTAAGSLLFSTWAAVDTHGFAAALISALERVFPDDPPSFVVAVPHGYHDQDRVREDLSAAGLTCVSAEVVTLTGTAPSAAEVAVGFCTGTPLRAAIEARGELRAATDLVAEEMTATLGTGPVTVRMEATVFTARPV